jgi:hypothetical protein
MTFVKDNDNMLPENILLFVPGYEDIELLDGGDYDMRRGVLKLFLQYFC